MLSDCSGDGISPGKQTDQKQTERCGGVAGDTNRYPTTTTTTSKKRVKINFFLLLSFFLSFISYFYDYDRPEPVLLLLRHKKKSRKNRRTVGSSETTDEQRLRSLDSFLFYFISCRARQRRHFRFFLFFFSFFSSATDWKNQNKQTEKKKCEESSIITGERVGSIHPSRQMPSVFFFELPSRSVNESAAMT